MRLLGSADWHLGLQRYGRAGPDGVGSRIHDFTATLSRFVHHAIRETVDVAVFAGDTFNTRRDGPHERAAFAWAVKALTDAGIAVLITDGNHDGKTTVGTVESASLLWLDRIGGGGATVILEPSSVIVKTKSGPLSVTVMPYPHRQLLDEEMPEVSPTDRVLLAGGRVERQIAAMAASIDSAKMPRLFVGHLTVADSIAGSETAMQMGWDVAIRRTALKPFDLSVLGHIHRFQRLSKTTAWYCGSPEYIDFTEAGLDKGFLLADFDHRVAPVVTLIPSEARPMFNLGALPNADGSLDIAAVEGQQPIEWERGPILRVEIVGSRPDVAEVAKLQRLLLARGASFVKTVVRAPADVTPRGTPEPTAPDPELDFMEATRRYLVAEGFPRVDDAMEAARVLRAQAA